MNDRPKLKVLDLFSGIGGFSLGLERTGGFETVAFCEIDPFCQKVLQKHWPDVPIFDDVRELTADAIGFVDIITGGFPCQDVSLAGRREGLDGARSGLWTEIARLIGDLRPRYAIVENTPGLLSLGMGRVLGDLVELRYDAQWYCVPACYVGADHPRDRVWIIAYPANRQSVTERRPTKSQKEMAENAANTMQQGLQGRGYTRADYGDAPTIGARIRLALRSSPVFPREYRQHKPVLGRGIHGVPDRVDRIKALGNAVVPQIPEIIGRAILMAENQISDSEGTG